MKAALLILYAGFLFTGCKSKDRPADNILPQKKMQAVLWDMMRADQFVADYALKKDSSFDRKTESIKLYQKIFLIHKINKEVFQKSFSFYKSHPALLKVIMDSLSKVPEPVAEKIIKSQPGTDTTLKLKKDSFSRDTTRSLKRIKHRW